MGIGRRGTRRIFRLAGPADSERRKRAVSIERRAARFSLVVWRGLLLAGPRLPLRVVLANNYYSFSRQRSAAGHTHDGHSATLAARDILMDFSCLPTFWRRLGFVSSPRRRRLLHPSGPAESHIVHSCYSSR